MSAADFITWAASITCACLLLAVGGYLLHQLALSVYTDWKEAKR